MTRIPVSRSKGQGHQAALLTAVLTRQAAAAVSVETYWACEATATLRSAGAVGLAARGASAPREGGEGRGHIVAAARLQLVLANMTVKLFTRTLTLHKVVRQQI